MAKPHKLDPPIKRPAPTAEHVLGVLLAKFDPDAEWSLVGQPRKSRQALVYRARSPGRDVDVAVKVYHQLLHSHQPRWQYEALEGCYAAMQGPRFVAARPLGWLQDEHTLFMEWVDGSPLSSQLWSWRLVPDRRRLDLLAEAGQWLRAYHASNGVATQPFEPEEVLRWIDWPFATDPALEEQMMADPLFAATLGHLRTAAARLAGEPLQHTAVHGDFTPYNLFDTGERLVGIDMLALHEQPVLSDLSRFMIYVDVRKFAITLPRQMNPLGVRAADAEALLGGYGMSLAEATSPVALVVHLAEVMRRWARVGQKTRSGNSKRFLWQHEAWRMRRMTAHVASCLDQAMARAS